MVILFFLSDGLFYMLFFRRVEFGCKISPFPGGGGRRFPQCYAGVLGGVILVL